ncbi:hypothetical protein THMIRHAS_20980 [Thiosulfatimonas sediminis]|uniref:histidine kinase n=1 Tax=Thiosulfatimonas sediminis TaxID=2675054 RepID=A0A6F8PX73_9GAMM|nr:ATP-binding protein [Thiosulfatimonas sediminis]BBP46725.1 hypothetical protein THMIRHAS_20980 [Thiosulfatimonas sediminis]
MTSFEIVSAVVATAILSGSALVGFFYVRNTRRLSLALSELHALNHKLEHDAINFFRKAWPVLHAIGVQQIAAKIRWFGEDKQIQLGEPTESHSIQEYKQFEHGQMAFDVVLRLPRKVARVGTMHNLVLQTFFNILEQDILLKEQQVTSTQKRLERYQMFVQHEIKNIAQFISLLSTQVERIESDEDKIRLVARLKKTLPTMAERAQKTIQTMKDPSLSKEKQTTFDVTEVLKEVVQMFDLPCKVLGSAEVVMRRELLLEVFKNVLGNFRDHNVGNELTIYVADNAQPNKVEIQIQNRNIPGLMLHPERMFEPFWTTSASGLGLGLFLARELLKQVAGEIKFHQTSQHFGFVISVPKERLE